LQNIDKLWSDPYIAGAMLGFCTVKGGRGLMKTNRAFPEALTLNIIREPACTAMTTRKRQVCIEFGASPREAPTVVMQDVAVRLGAGRIVCITGPSGRGKSSLLRRIAEEVGSGVWVSRQCFDANTPLVDSIAARGPLTRALEILTACGLGEPRLWLRRFGDLADGEKFRAQLARAIGTAQSRSTLMPILCDEFTSQLHRRLAKSVAYNLRKLVTRRGLLLIVATTHDDICRDLQPNQIVRLENDPPDSIECAPQGRAFSLSSDLAVEPGSLSDYHSFGPMHYRGQDRLGFVDQVFVLRDTRLRDLLGVLVFGHAPPELRLRNLATAGRFVCNLHRLNRELRILRRLVMHPDVRGCGLGHWFVRAVLPKARVRFVECMAAMGSINPVLERAGMTRVGQCPLPRGRLALIERMTKLGIDPYAMNFGRQIAGRPRVRRLVEGTLRDWTRTSHSTGLRQLAGRDVENLAQLFRQVVGAPPVYYLWDREGEFPPSRQHNARRDPDSPPRERSPRPSHDEVQRGTDRHSPDRAPGSKRSSRDSARFG
jgi:ABC-type lipoprotein export system ATPase subunit/GNAT superfamily N-acetyltransferase